MVNKALLHVPTVKYPFALTAFFPLEETSTWILHIKDRHLQPDMVMYHESAFYKGLTVCRGRCAGWAEEMEVNCSLTVCGCLLAYLGAHSAHSFISET
jgi:hypothetical protein